MKKIFITLAMMLLSSAAVAFENITYYGHFAATTNAATLITTQGLGVANSKFIVNKRAVSIFQTCGVPVLQYTGFIKIGSCNTYKAGSQLWQRSATTTNSDAVGVRLYPSTTPATTIYATPDMEPFIVGGAQVYAWQDCTQADNINYTLVGTCTSGLALWKRTTPLF